MIVGSESIEFVAEIHYSSAPILYAAPPEAAHITRPRLPISSPSDGNSGSDTRGVCSRVGACNCMKQHGYSTAKARLVTGSSEHQRMDLERRTRR